MAKNGLKDGVRSSEFWVTLIMSAVNAILGVLVLYGILTDETSSMIAQIIQYLLLAILPIVTGWMVTRYTQSRTAIKIEHMMQTAVPLNPLAD